MGVECVTPPNISEKIENSGEKIDCNAGKIW